MLAFPKGDGLRIDHIFASPTLASSCSEVRVDREERKGAQPSDHAPVIAVFN
jgi:exodeoxyribonuclease-3